LRSQSWLDRPANFHRSQNPTKDFLEVCNNWLLFSYVGGMGSNFEKNAVQNTVGKAEQTASVESLITRKPQSLAPAQWTEGAFVPVISRRSDRAAIFSPSFSRVFRICV
jgi:hypothetical protein